MSATTLFAPVGPVAARFGASRALVKSIMGPVGGGKTTECIANAIRIGGMQEPIWDEQRRCFVKKCRGAVVRDSYPNLDRTVIKSWHKWFPETLGKWKWDAPRSHRFTLYMGRRGTAGYYELDMEVLFVGIGDHAVEDVLRGFELTWLWLNEVDLMPRSLVEFGIGRVGRYPSGGEGRCLMPQIFCDFNAPEEDNWTVPMLIEQKLDPEIMAVLEEQFGGENARPVIQFFRQPGGLDEGAENLVNLEGGKRYYLVQAALLPKDIKRRLIDNRIGPVRHGTPVYPEFVDDHLYDAAADARPSGHVRAFEVDRDLPVLIGADQGICPGLVFGQLDPVTDQLRVFDELARIFENDDGSMEVSQMGGEAFGRQAAARLTSAYPMLHVGLATCDPAGAQGEQAIGHSSWRRDFQKGLGVNVRRCSVPGNSIDLRTKAVRDRFGAKLPDKPRLIVHPRCKILRKAFNSKYVYVRVAKGAASDGGRFADTPSKTQGYADVANALEYLAFEISKGLEFSATGPARGRGRGRQVINESH